MSKEKILEIISKLENELQKEFSQYSKTWLKNKLITLRQELINK